MYIFSELIGTERVDEMRKFQIGFSVISTFAINFISLLIILSEVYLFIGNVFYCVSKANVINLKI